MQYGVLGTGTVGQTLATRLTELGHDVMMGSRSALLRDVGWTTIIDPGDITAARGRREP